MTKKRGVEELKYGESRLASGSSAFGDGGGTTHAHKERPPGVRAEANGNSKEMLFHSLHHHTTFSYLDGYGLPEAHMRRAAELMMPAVAVTEHGNISSHVKAEVAAQKHGIKPLFGCEFYMVENIKQNTQKKYHLTVLAQNKEGYANLLQLVSAAYAEGHHYEPTIDFGLLARYGAGLVVLSGCQGSLLFCSAVGGKLIEEADASYQRAYRVAKRFKKLLGDRYFLEVQAFPELDKTRRFAPIAARLSRALGIELVATLDIHYTVPEESEIQKVLHNVRPGEKRTLEDLERDWGYNVPLCPPMTDGNVYTRLRLTGLGKKDALRAVANTALIARACNVTLPRLPMLRFPLPVGYENSKDLLYAWIRDGWRYRGMDKEPYVKRQEYKEKLRRELDVIEGKDFIDYFLLNSDAVRFAKDSGIPVGPARGSAAASLVCWLLRITEVDPMLFPNLVFERFIDVSRADLPDIDLDFPAWGRPIVRDYLVAKYGEQSVGNIGTFTYYKAKLALDDVGKVHRIPKYEVATVKELLIERSSGDLRASATIEDTVEHFDAAADVAKRHPQIKLAMELEGNVKTGGVHAAGLVVANGDIRDVCAMYQKVVNGFPIQVVSMDKYDAERQNLLKLDYLALATLDMITYALRQIGMTLEELYRIPLEHPSIIEGFRENDCTGIFQFDGRAARSINQVLKPDTFIEICDVIALCRPGPLHSGAAGRYIDVKWGREKAAAIHPALASITKATHGQIVYQEQILRVVTEVGAFDWTSASAIRRIMSKKEGSAKFNQAWEAFWEGARTLHKRTEFPRMMKDMAREIWNGLITAGAYAFNFAHCVSYGMLGAWAMWIKRNHPEIFYASALAELPPGNKVPDQHESLMRDCIRKNIPLRPPHPRYSGPTWSVSRKGGVRAGFIQIDGVGDKLAPVMEKFRRANKPKTWNRYQEIKGVGPKTIEKIETMVKSDDPFGVYALTNTLASVREQIDAGDLGPVPYPTHVGTEIPYDKSGDVEVVYLGMPVKRNLRDIFESHRARTGEELDPESVRDADLRELVVMTCYDGTDLVTVRFDRWKYPQFKASIWECRLEKDLVLVRGVKPNWRTAREIYASDMWVIDPEDD